MRRRRNGCGSPAAELSRYLTYPQPWPFIRSLQLEIFALPESAVADPALCPSLTLHQRGYTIDLYGVAYGGDGVRRFTDNAGCMLTAQGGAPCPPNDPWLQTGGLLIARKSARIWLSSARG